MFVARMYSSLLGISVLLRRIIASWHIAELSLNAVAVTWLYSLAGTLNFSNVLCAVVGGG